MVRSSGDDMGCGGRGGSEVMGLLEGRGGGVVVWVSRLGEGMNQEMMGIMVRQTRSPLRARGRRSLH